LIKKYLKQYFDEHPEQKSSASIKNTDQSSPKPNTLSSPPSSSDASMNASIGITNEVDDNQASPTLKTVKKFTLKKNAVQTGKRKKLQKNRGRSIFKRRKGKLRRGLGKGEGKKQNESSDPTAKENEEEKKDLTPEDGRCKYSSGKVNGLEKCIGCGVGYSSNSALKRHYESVHLRIKKAQCPYCPVRMSQRHNLRNHINAIHLNNKRHQCKVCQFSCWKKPDFERHMQKHEEGDPLQEENGDKDTEKVKEGDDSIDKTSIDDGKLSASSPSAKSKCKKSLPSVKRKRNQRKKNTSIDENEQANNHHSDSNRNHNSNQSKDLLTPSQSYPTYVITKRAGCGRSGRHRKKKLQPKTKPKRKKTKPK